MKSKLLLLLTLLFGMSFPALAQEEFNDSIDRTADDFVVASVCIVDPTDWHDDILGVSGHAFIRLQCATFDMDYCFSYESENAEEELGRFLRGDLHMGMFSLPTEEYIKPFRRWNRTVREYKLNLPPDTKQRLWEIMDNKVAEGPDLQLDLVRRGCTQTLVRFVEQALNGTEIEYDEWPAEYQLTRREILNESLAPYPWIRFFFSELLLDADFNEVVPNARKITLPRQLEEVWQKAKVEGKPLMVYRGNLVTGECPEVEPTLFTPLILATLVLLLTVLFLFVPVFSKVVPVWNSFLLIAQALVGIALLWLVFVSNLPGSKGVYLLALYNPLPLLLWRWRRLWALPYAALLVIWAVVVSVMPNIYVEMAHIVFAGAVVITLAKIRHIGA